MDAPVSLFTAKLMTSTVTMMRRLSAFADCGHQSVQLSSRVASSVVEPAESRTKSESSRIQDVNGSR